ncbi:MAG: Trk system potassium transporter TrkA [Chloroflexota bacterium]|nr:Trk system potassium transporter TrkA [Chloroflexota bacterium]
MYIIIVSAGVIGSRVAAMLVKEGHDVVVIDESEIALDSLSLRLDVKTVVGSPINPQVQLEADVSSADVIVAVTRHDELNIITCFIAKELGARKTVAKIQNLDYPGYFIGPASSPNAPRRIVRPKKLGVDLLINPEAMTAQHILNTLSSLFITPTESLSDGLVQIAEFEVEREVVTNIPLRHLDFSKPARIIAIVREKDNIIPDDDDVLELKDHVFVISTPANMNEIGKMFSRPLKPAKSIVIAGGGAIGFHLAQELEKLGTHVKIIEKDMQRCQEIAKKLNKTLIIQGEVTSQDYLRDEGVASADAFVAAANRDELNILISLLAKNLGSVRSLAVVNRPEYMSLAKATGIDFAISPLLLAGNELARFIHQSRVLSAASLADGKTEALEFLVQPDSPVVGQHVKDIEFPKKAILGAIVRKSKVIIPQSDDIIEQEDRVILVGFQSFMPNAEKIFEHR